MLNKFVQQSKQENVIDVCLIAINFGKNNSLNKLLKRLTHWESWPFNLLYAPLLPFWIYYILKSRAVWFFTPSNPKITFGGLEGEPKREMYDLLPKHLYPKTINFLPTQSFDEIQQVLLQEEIKYPFVVKPEVGGQGILFRKIDHEKQLLHYHQKVPVEFIVQELVTYPMEVSVFYIRHPQSKHGEVTGFLHKIPMQVIGDGNSTLEQLILSHPKASKRIDEMFQKHKHLWNNVLDAGEKYMLSYAANHNRGARFVDLKVHIDEKLVQVFDQLSHDVNDFFYGRYDIMCESIENLKQGKNYTILEYNGCGAEPNHFYDTGYTLIGAYKEIFYHWEKLYTISAYNTSQGVKPWSFKKGYQFLKSTKILFKKMRAVDVSLD